MNSEKQIIGLKLKIEIADKNVLVLRDTDLTRNYIANNKVYELELPR